MPLSGAKKSLVNSVPNEVIVTVAKVEDSICKLCEKELPSLHNSESEMSGTGQIVERLSRREVWSGRKGWELY